MVHEDPSGLSPLMAKLGDEERARTGVGSGVGPADNESGSAAPGTAAQQQPRNTNAEPVHHDDAPRMRSELCKYPFREAVPGAGLEELWPDPCERCHLRAGR